MKINGWLGLMTAALLAGTAAMQAGEKVTVKGDRVNVRGQAAMAGEVITQLRKGETVTVLEQIPVTKPKTNEPALWAKISLPTNTPVWINAQFVDAEKKTINSKRLNIRSGPGENFSVIGRLLQGASVKDIRTVEGWMEIEAPEGCYAFVAGDLLDLSKGSVPAPEVPAPTVVKNTPPPAVKPPEPPPITVVETVKNDAPPAPVVDAKPEVKKPEPPPAPKPVEPAPVVETKPAPAPVVVPPPITEPAPAPPATTEPLPPRIVTREGIVRRTLSIQAPGKFRLADPDTDKTINYLYEANTGLQLKYYAGQRIRITGPESTDVRWPNTPLIEIKTLEPLP